jgi:hypothetical protein
MGRFSTGLAAGLGTVLGAPYASIVSDAMDVNRTRGGALGTPEAWFICPECKERQTIGEVNNRQCPGCGQEISPEGLGFPEVEVECPDCNTTVGVYHTGSYQCGECAAEFTVGPDCFENDADLCSNCFHPLKRGRKGSTFCSECGVDDSSELFQTMDVVYSIMLLPMMAKILASAGAGVKEMVDINPRQAGLEDLDTADRDHARSLLETAIEDEATIWDYTDRFVRVFGTEERESGYAALWKCAALNKTLNPATNHILMNLLPILGLDPEVYDHNLELHFGRTQDRPSLRELYDCYATLKSSPDDNEQDLKAKYRELSRLYHPDVAGGGQGLSPAIADLVDQKMKQINAAWDLIKKHRGWS